MIEVSGVEECETVFVPTTRTSQPTATPASETDSDSSL